MVKDNKIFSNNRNNLLKGNRSNLFENNIPNSISGRYEGNMTGSNPKPYLLELRIDMDQRYPNSPVMNLVSGDFFKIVPGLGNISALLANANISEDSKIFLESWIMENPRMEMSETEILIIGTVRWWNPGHLLTEMMIKIPLNSSVPEKTANVTCVEIGQDDFEYKCHRESDSFRDISLEIDVTKSVVTNHPEPILPSYDIHSHAKRPFDLPRRTLSIEECYREAGVNVSLNPQRDIIDDTAVNLHELHDAELHEIMTNYYSQYQGTWPNWKMWGILCGSYQDLDRPASGPFVLGIMFDAYLQTTRVEERQGFAIFRNHRAFDNLVAGTPTNQNQASSMRDFLYTYIHEAGHAFNFVHSWDKNRETSESFMNYPDSVDELFNQEGYFWKNFYFRFDNQELIHLRHGNRPSVIMGGDAWASGLHLETIEGGVNHKVGNGFIQVEGNNLPIEFLLRSEPYFEFLETVSIELRIKNLLPININVKSILNPAYGNVIILIQSPSGKVTEYKPVIV